MSLAAFKVRLSRWLLAYAPRPYALLTRRTAGLSYLDASQHRTGLGGGGENGPSRILVVDHDFPELGRDAGSTAIFHLMRLLADRAKVTLWSASAAPSAEGMKVLQSAGIQTAARQDGRDLASWLGTLSAEHSFDAVILSRPIIAAIYAGVIRRHVGGCVCAYYGHDIHHARLAGMRKFAANAGLDAEQREIGRIERRLWRTMDVVFYPSDEEVGIVNAFRADLGLEPNAVMLPLWNAPEAPVTVEPAEKRSGMLFVGSFDHAPNVDGLNWFFSEILPDVRRQGRQDIVYVVGSGMNRYRPPTDDSLINVLGRIDDEALNKLYTKARIALVPLRYGAGVKGKVIEAMGKGVPCVTTSIGAHGLGWASEVLKPCDDAKDFASAVVRLMRDEALWQENSSKGLRLLSAAYERSTMSKRLFSALGLRETPRGDGETTKCLGSTDPNSGA